MADIFGSRCRPMSAVSYPGRAWSKMWYSVYSHWNRVEIHFRSKVISSLLAVLVAASLIFGCRPMLGHVISAISESAVLENVEVAVETTSPSPSVQKLSLLLFFACHFRVLSRHFCTSGQSKRETSSCKAFIQVIGI